MVFCIVGYLGVSLKEENLARIVSPRLDAFKARQEEKAVAESFLGLSDLLKRDEKTKSRELPVEPGLVNAWPLADGFHS